MKRVVSRRITAAGVLLAAVWSSSQVEAASFILDLRVDGQTGAAAKNATVAYVGDAVTIDVVALVAGSDANTDNEGIYGLSMAFNTNNANTTGNLRGNLTSTLGSAFQDVVSHVAPSLDVDSDGDFESGSSTSNSSSTNYNDYFSVNTPGAVSAAAVTEIINGKTYAHFDLGQLTFTAGGGYTSTSIGSHTGSGSVSPGQSTTISTAFFRGSGILHPQQIMFDGTFTQMYGTDSRISVGSPLTISVGPIISLTSAATRSAAGTATIGNGQNLIDDQSSSPFAAGSVAINDIGNQTGTFIAGINTTGVSNLSALATALSTNGWTVSVLNGAIPGLPGTWQLKATTANPTAAGANDFLDIDLAGQGLVTQVAAIPEPSMIGLIGLGAMVARQRRRRA